MGATSFFHSAHVTKAAASFCHRTKVMNIGEVFADPIIAAVILDRLLHHSTTINVRGASYIQTRPGWGIFNRNPGEFHPALTPRNSMELDWGDSAFGMISANSIDAEQARLFIRPATQLSRTNKMLASSSLCRTQPLAAGDCTDPVGSSVTQWRGRPVGGFP